MTDTSLNRGQIVYAPQKNAVDIKQVSTVILRQGCLILRVSCVVMSVAGLLALSAKPIYQSSMQILISSKVSEREESSNITVGTNTNKDLIGSTSEIVDTTPQIELLLSSKLIEKALDLLRSEYHDLKVEDIKGKNHKNGQKSPFVVTLIEDGTRNNRVSGQIFELSFESSDPVKAQKVLQALQKVYKDYSVKLRKEHLANTLAFVSDRLTIIKQELRQAEENLEKFRKKHNLIDPELQGKILLESLGDIRKQLQITRAQLQDVQARYKNLQKELAYSPQNASSDSRLSQKDSYQTLVDEIQKTELALAEERQRYTDDFPAVQKLIEVRQNQVGLLQKEIERSLAILNKDSSTKKSPASSETNINSTQLAKWETLRQALAKQPSPEQNLDKQPLVKDLLGEFDQKLMQQLVEVQTTAEGLRANEQSLTQSEKQISSELSKYPNLISQYNRLLPEVQANRKKLEQLAATQQSLGLKMAQTKSDLQVLEEPQRGTYLGSNSLLFILGGLVISPLLGVGAALIKELSNNTVYSSQELQKLTNLRLLATVPKLKRPRRYKQLLQLPSIWQENKDKQLSDSKTLPVYAAWPAHETLDMAYQNIQLITSFSAKSVMLTSAQSGEGKTTLALGLAVSAARMHKRVLIIDANFQKPSLHKILELSNDWGLSLLLVDEAKASVKDYIQAIHPSIDVLTAGSTPEDRIKLLSSERMKELLESFEQTYDLVLIDAPAVLNTVDARILATLCDRIVMVARFGKVTKADLIQATDFLSSLNLIGVIANTAQ